MASIKTYYLAARNTWDETVIYRLNFAVWRLRVFLALVSTYFLWLTLLPSGKTFGNYNQASMLTYILGSSILYAVIMSTRTSTVVDDIIQGNLSNYLIRPINYMMYYFSRDIGDKAINIIFSLAEVTLLFLLLHPPFFWQTNMLYILAFIISVVSAVCLNFFLNMMLSFVGFFSPEAWGPRFIFFILVTFLAGVTFPLDILPKPLFWIFELLPFPSMLYAPMKIYLGQLSPSFVVLYLFVGISWSLILWKLVNVVWGKGITLYSAEGK